MHLILCILSGTGDGEDTNSTSTLNIDISYQQLHFSSSKVFLGWNLFDRNNAIENIRPGLRYSVTSSTCNRNNISTVNTTNTSAILPLDGDENLYYSIIALNENGELNSTLNEPFRISSGGILLHCVTES